MNHIYINMFIENFKENFYYHNNCIGNRYLTKDIFLARETFQFCQISINNIYYGTLFFFIFQYQHFERKIMDTINF